MKENNETISDRIKQFAKENYGSVNKLALELRMSQPQMQNYVSGKTMPGAEILLKLYNAGCDINWILSGEKKSTEIEMLNILKLHGIKSIEQLRKLFDFDSLSNDIVNLLNQRIK